MRSWRARCLQAIVPVVYTKGALCARLAHAAKVMPHGNHRLLSSRLHLSARTSIARQKSSSGSSTPVDSTLKVIENVTLENQAPRVHLQG